MCIYIYTPIYRERGGRGGGGVFATVYIQCVRKVAVQLGLYKVLEVMFTSLNTGLNQIYVP
jgi:hypothetical protein